MLWAAGQKRLARESRSRRAELYEAVRDGYLAGEIAIGRAKPSGSYRMPGYLEEERDPEAARRGLRDLVASHGGNVSRAESAAAMRAAFMTEVRPETGESVN
jgi:hypothetical protein